MLDSGFSVTKGQNKTRLDQLLLERGLAESRHRAQGLILSGNVIVGGQRAAKAGMQVCPDVALEVVGGGLPYVSRGGVKLAHALAFFHLNVQGRRALDVGASTGGFTDCLLQAGAERVYAVDVGYGQLAWKLRQDKRVVVIERQNIRSLTTSQIPEKIDLAVVDVSFISLKRVLPKVVAFLNRPGILVALIKPQFEAGRGEVGRGGVVRREEIRGRVVEEIVALSEGLDLEVDGVTPSPILGPQGNQEYLICARYPEGPRV